MAETEKAKKTQLLHRQKETKGTVVFGTQDPSALVSSLYVRKGAGFDEATSIRLTIEEA